MKLAEALLENPDLAAVITGAGYTLTPVTPEVLDHHGFKQTQGYRYKCTHPEVERVPGYGPPTFVVNNGEGWQTGFDGELYDLTQSTPEEVAEKLVADDVALVAPPRQRRV